MGDVKLAGMMGLFLGLSVIPALRWRFSPARSSGSRSSCGTVATHARPGSRSRPFLALGGFVGVLAGNELISLYADRFL